MNANAMPLPPASVASQGQPANGKPADPAAADVPFSQVFSGELARKAGQVEENTETNVPVLPTDALAAMLADPGARVDPAAADSALSNTADPSASPAETAAGTDMLLALAVAAEGLKPEPIAPAEPAAAATAADVAAATTALPQTAVVATATAAAAAAPTTKGGLPAAAATAAGASAPAAVATTRTDAAGETAMPAARGALPSPTEANAGAADSATPDALAFAERLAAARQSDPAGAGERVSELMSHPALRSVAQAVPSAPAAADPTDARLAPSVGTAAWGQALGEKLVWMAAGTQQTASITLNPPNLGPLQVVLNVSNDQATANFFAAQPEVRQAIESAFPKLREMMNEAGIQLGQATVSAETPRQQDMPERQAQSTAFGSRSLQGDDVESAAPIAMAVRQAGRGLVDTFA